MRAHQFITDINEDISRRTNPGGMKKDERRVAMAKIQRQLEKQRGKS